MATIKAISCRYILFPGEIIIYKTFFFFVYIQLDDKTVMTSVVFIDFETGIADCLVKKK